MSLLVDESQERRTPVEIVAAIDVQLKTLSQDVSLIKGSLPPLRERLTLVEARMDALRDRSDDRYDRVMKLIEENTRVIGEVSTVADKLMAAAKDLTESPSLLFLMRRQPLRTLAVTGGLILTGVTMWVGLWAFVSIPGVDEWLRLLLNIPTP